MEDSNFSHEYHCSARASAVRFGWYLSGSNRFHLSLFCVQCSGRGTCPRWLLSILASSDLTRPLPSITVSMSSSLILSLQTLSTAVVQIFLADQTSGNTRRWNKRCTGVLTFIKDSDKKSYFLRVYDLKVTASHFINVSSFLISISLSLYRINQ